MVMDSNDEAILRTFADSAHQRALDHHMKAQAEERGSDRYWGYMSDFFYWSGKATAYAGVAAGIGLRNVVLGELDSEGSCP